MEKGECSGCHGSILRKNIEKKQTHPLKKPLVFLRYQTFRSFMYTIMGNHKEKGSPQNQNDSTSLTTKYTETTPKECFTPSRQNDLRLSTVIAWDRVSRRKRGHRLQILVAFLFVLLGSNLDAAYSQTSVAAQSPTTLHRQCRLGMGKA